MIAFYFKDSETIVQGAIWKIPNYAKLETILTKAGSSIYPNAMKAQPKDFKILAMSKNLKIAEFDQDLLKCTTCVMISNGIILDAVLPVDIMRSKVDFS